MLAPQTKRYVWYRGKTECLILGDMVRLFGRRSVSIQCLARFPVADLGVVFRVYLDHICNVESPAEWLALDSPGCLTYRTCMSDT